MSEATLLRLKGPVFKWLYKNAYGPD